MRRSLPFQIFAYFMCITALATPAAGRQGIGGVVLDTSRRPLPGATVTLRTDRRPPCTVATDAAGRFVFDDPWPSAPTIVVTLEGFEPATVQPDAPAGNLQVILRPAVVREHVNVTGRAPDGEIASATRTPTPLRDVPQAVTVVSRDIISGLAMQGMADIVRFVPGIGMAQGEGNRDTPIFRGNSSTSDFYVDGVRDDVQYFRDLYNVERVEAVKGPNALLFGRGGVGGIINRVTRQAGWAPVQEVVLQAGSYDQRRLTADFGAAPGSAAAVRVSAMLEDSGSYRRGVGLNRYGLNPTAAFRIGTRTILRAGFEHFHDNRTADRGVPSLDGKPLAGEPSAFFGNPSDSTSRVTVDAIAVALDRQVTSAWSVRSRFRAAAYGKFYQNVYPSTPVQPASSTVTLSAYNNATDRTNLFGQTDMVGRVRTGAVGHVLLGGLEIGRQSTTNFRQTGYFAAAGGGVASVRVPAEAPVTSLPVTFRQSPSDADNRSLATVAALFVQDQVELSRHVHAVLGLRYDRFVVDVHNNRTGSDLSSHDGLVSPRLALIYKPATPVSMYASYTRSYLPRAGEQLSSLSASNESLDPEAFQNYEVGAKWQVRPGFAASVATYRLNRGNVVVPDPQDPTRSLLADGQRTQGLELDFGGRLTRAWSVIGAYAWQDGEITRTLSPSVRAGARLAQLPRHSFSVWTRYDLTRRYGAGLGVVRRDDVFASTDNSVVLPAFTRVDGALFFAFDERIGAQVNVENLLDRRYFLFSNGNNNITPGSPRALRVSLTTRF
jgi:catecholate siderophore receptor